MSHQSTLIASNIDEYLAQHERKELLRFITCGSVDDGKSTLIGRLFYESKMIYEDQLAAIKKDTSRYGTTGEEVDLALLDEVHETLDRRGFQEIGQGLEIEQGGAQRLAIERIVVGHHDERAGFRQGVPPRTG